MWRRESTLVYRNIFMSGKDNVLLMTCDISIKSSGGEDEAPKLCSLTMHFTFLSYLDM